MSPQNGNLSKTIRFGWRWPNRYINAPERVRDSQSLVARCAKWHGKWSKKYEDNFAALVFSASDLGHLDLGSTAGGQWHHQLWVRLWNHSLFGLFVVILALSFCRRLPNVAQFLPIFQGALLANRNPGLPIDGSANLARGPVINVIEVVLGSAREA